MLNQISHGDLARLFQTNASNSRVKSEITTLAQELTSGRKRDLAAAVGGDFAPITDIEYNLERNSAYKTAGSEASSFAKVMQNALQTISTLNTDGAKNMLLANQAAQPDMISTAASAAAAKLAPVLSALNTQFGGRSVFSGQDVDSPAVVDEATFIADITAATAGATDVASFMAAIDTWFDAGGGYETVAYSGSSTPLDPVDIGQGVSADLGFTALEPELRDVLKGLAIATLVADGAFTGDPSARRTLIGEAGTLMLNSENSLTDLRAKVGTVEELIAVTDVARAAQTSALTLARAELVEIDPYETATRLEAASSQLEMLYSMTARMQSLSLVNYL